MAYHIDMSIRVCNSGFYHKSSGLFCQTLGKARTIEALCLFLIASCILQKFYILTFISLFSDDANCMNSLSRTNMLE